MLYAQFGQFGPIYRSTPRLHDIAGITASVDKLAKISTEVTLVIGNMIPDDPLRAEHLRELCELTELHKLPRSELNKLIHKKLSELAREIRTLEASDPRRNVLRIKSSA